MNSPFLARVGQRERSPIRWAAWLILGVGLTFCAWFFVALVLQLVDPELVELANVKGPLPDGPGRLLDETRYTVLIASLLLATALAVLYAARLAFHRPAWTFVTPAQPFRPRLLLLGSAMFGALALAGLLVESTLRGDPLQLPILDSDYALGARGIYLLGAVLFLLMAAAAEEIIFRGVLLQFTAAFTRNLPLLLLINGVVFSAFHLDPSPEAFVARAVSGAVWAWTALRLAGLEFAIGAHLANNLLLSLLVEPISEGAQLDRDYPLSVVTADLALSGLLVVGLLAALRSPALRAWAGVEPPARVEDAFD